MVGFIGRQPVNGNFVKLDSITTSATATFNLLNGGVAYYPESARNCIVSLNGVIQSPETAYNIVNNTIVFSTALTSDDVIDHIIVLGDVNALATVSDATVTTAKLGADAVNGTKIADDSIDSEHIVDGSVDLAHMSSQSVDEDNLHISNAGTNGQFLSKQSGDTGGLTWADAGGGKVLQVVSGVDGTTRSTTSTSFVTASNTCTCAITPAATSSKILLMFNSDIYAPTADQAITIYRDSTNIGHTDYGFDYCHSAASIRQSTIIHLDSPNTSSQVTYQIYIRKVSGGGTFTIGNNTDISSLQAIEIGA